MLIVRELELYFLVFHDNNFLVADVVIPTAKHSKRKEEFSGKEFYSNLTVEVTYQLNHRWTN